MSGGATMAAGETAATEPVARYLRRNEPGITQSWALEWDLPLQCPTEPGANGEWVACIASPTEELRRRIAEAAMPEPRAQPRGLWLGLAALVILLTVGLMFPDAFAALLPGADPLR